MPDYATTTEKTKNNSIRAGSDRTIWFLK